MNGHKEAQETQELTGMNGHKEAQETQKLTTKKTQELTTMNRRREALEAAKKEFPFLRLLCLFVARKGLILC
jgi:hypothetical protein